MTAHAQTEEDDIDAILGLDRAPEPAPASAAPTPAPFTAPVGTINAPETYVVRYGDTLWDLCAKFLNNPWYWPKIWSYNPGLDNPHWINPGTVLRFYPQTEESPAPVQPSPMAPENPGMALAPAPGPVAPAPVADNRD